MLRTAIEVVVLVIKIGSIATPFLERWARALPKTPPRLPG